MIDAVAFDKAHYSAELEAWREHLTARLKAEDGWLTLTGLYWLHEGENTLGSDPTATVVLPGDGTPAQVGSISLDDGRATLHLTTDSPVQVGDSAGEPGATYPLHHDEDAGGATQVKIGTATFFAIKRGKQYGVRVRDSANPARETFAGRRWFAPDPAYRVVGQFTPHMAGRTIEVDNVIGTHSVFANPGVVSFRLHGQPLTLQAFDQGEGELWFVFRDATSGHSTYGASRFLTAPLAGDGTVILDFNRAYNPPCAFTPYATCPLPPRDNILPVTVEAGELDVEDER